MKKLKMLLSLFTWVVSSLPITTAQNILILKEKLTRQRKCLQVSILSGKVRPYDIRANLR